ncbi:MAG: ATP-dependent Clp protease proteolytic subunit [Synechococcales cyanobacterium RM1_1_8]|nr:ATP-dependent Clp protease proteolytic subunit [Synechococcales cyanobacterium RM1_1_8]
MPVDRPVRVPYQIPGGQRWQWVNLYTRMSQERILFLNSPLTDSVANSLVSSMLYLDSDEQKPIYLYINSLGDPVLAGMAGGQAGMMSVMAGLAIYDTMQYIKSDIVTVCLGQAVGMAAVLLAAGTPGKRACLPHATIALVHPTSLTQGQATDIQVAAKTVMEKQALIRQILAKSTGQSTEKLKADMDRMFYLSPSEAQDYGLIDRVVTTLKTA